MNIPTEIAKIIGEWTQQDTISQQDWQIFLREYQQHGNSYLRELLRARQVQHTFAKTMEAINTERDVKKLLDTILDSAILLMNAERGFLLVQDYQVARHFDGEEIVGEYKISQSIAATVRNQQQPIVTDNAQQDARFQPYLSVQQHRLLSIICVPLTIKGTSIGVLYLDNRLVRGNFHTGDVPILSAFANQAAIAIENAKLYQHIQQHNQELQAQIRTQTEEINWMRETLDNLRSESYHNIYAKSARMQEVFRLIEKIKESDLPVLIIGESGTGKELIAQAVHAKSLRQAHKFVSENCAAIPETIFESELFGYEKGAFTGANQSKKGLFEQANGGTLFLDEVGELPINVQKKLLRVLAEKSIRRVGGQQLIPIDVRIVTATNRDIKSMISQGLFREDLYYRLNAVEVLLPPLRERREDIPLLVQHFLEEFAQQSKTPRKNIDKRLLATLMSYDWPGNIRQLRNEIQRICTLSENVLSTQYLSQEIQGSNKKDERIGNLPQMLNETEKSEIAKALALCENNKSKAAQLLGITRFSLQRKIDKHKLEA